MPGTTKGTRAPGTPDHGKKNTFDAAAASAAAPCSPSHVSIDDLLIPPLDGMGGDLDDLENDFGLIDDDLFGMHGSLLGDEDSVHHHHSNNNNNNSSGDASGGPTLSGAGSGGSGGENDDDEETDAKKQARLIRNRESAQLSRQRKKQYLDELERRCRGLQTTNSELHGLVARLTAENNGLRAGSRPRVSSTPSHTLELELARALTRKVSTRVSVSPCLPCTRCLRVSRVFRSPPCQKDHVRTRSLLHDVRPCRVSQASKSRENTCACA